MPCRLPRSTHFPYTTLFRSYAYDAWNHKTGQQDADNKLMSWAYTGWLQTGHKDLSGANFSYTYNALNELTTQKSSGGDHATRSEEHTSELQSRRELVCRRLL